MLCEFYGRKVNMQNEFQFFITKIIHGVGSSRELGSVVTKLGAERALVMHGPNVKAAGIVDPCIKSLEDAGIVCVVYDKIEEETPMHSIEEAAELGRREKTDVCIAIGGGSCMDTAKVARMLITNPGTCRDYTTAIGTELYKKPGIPLICVPTTSGTGSEVTFTAVMHDVENQRKISTRDRDKLVPDYAILDPEVTVSLPKVTTGATGLDAMAHAIEGFLKPEAHCYSDPLCLQAMTMVYENLQTAWAEPENIEARDNMLLAANIAMGGMADVGVQIGHGIGQGLGAYTHAAHGITCAWALPYVIEHLCHTEAAKIRQIADAFKLGLPADADEEAVKDAVVAAIKRLSAAVELPMPKKLGFTMEKDYDNFVKFVLREQRLIQMSARPVSDDDVRAYMKDLLSRDS